MTPGGSRSIVEPIENAPRLIITGDAAPPPLGYYRIFLVRRGAAGLLDSPAAEAAEGGAQRRRTLLPRTALLACPRADYRILPAPGAETAGLAFGRSALDPESMGGEAAELLGVLARGEPVRVLRMPPASFDEAWAIRARIADELADDGPGSETMRRLRLAELLMLFYRFGPGAARREAPDASFDAEAAVGYIRERYAEDLGLESLACRFGLNPSYLSRAFAKSTGVHLMEFINRVRIEKGCAMLKRSSSTIVEIAFAVGYNNLSHFNRYFRKVVGMSPSEYRKMSRR